MNTKLRYNEYYGMQETLDDLYKRSKENGLNGYNLYDKIVSESNILLAYRTIKRNTGSKTKGTDGKTIKDYEIESKEEFIKGIRESLTNYKPGKVKRVDIPKANGDTRPLGIPTMNDRIIQQMFKQILEPIVEAKFYNHSYGFRPNRATKHALARSQFFVNISQLTYVVDIDIKGFFDNVNHNKLMKQLYSIGIKDKRVLAIVSKMLKAPISGKGIPTKGVPQGGILSPLLSNVVLNDLDQWVASQWDTMKTRNHFSGRNDMKIRGLRKTTSLKEMYIVRYADDFKIFTRTMESAVKIYHAVEKYLNSHLGLSISKDKSKVTDLKKNSTNFLGFKLKAKRKRNKYIAYTSIADNNKEEIKKKLKELTKNIQKQPTIQNINRYNSFVISTKNYYKHVTNVFLDLNEVAFKTMYFRYNRLNRVAKYENPKELSHVYKRYNKNNYKTFTIKGVPLHPINDVRMVNNYQFNQKLCNYTVEGRKLHEPLEEMVTAVIIELGKRASDKRSVEFQDNRLSKYSMQKGKCSVTNFFLTSDEVHCHHIKPKESGGTDEFKNLVIVSKEVHRLIHAENEETIQKYLGMLNLNVKQIKKVNQYRKNCNLDNI